MGNRTLVAMLHRGGVLVVTSLVAGGDASLMMEAQGEHGMATGVG